MPRIPGVCRSTLVMATLISASWLAPHVAWAASVLTITNPPNGSTVSGTVAVTVNASGFGSLTKVEFALDGVVTATDTATPWAWTWDTAAATTGPHTLTARGYNASNRKWTSASPVTVTVARTDTTPPSFSNIAATNLTTTAATITWTTNEPATSQVDYGLTASYGSSSPVDSTRVVSHRVSLSGLAPATLYHYRVRSTDAAGNAAASADQTLTTQRPPDTNPPTGSVTINGGAAQTASPQVTLTLAASDAEGPVTAMRCSNDGVGYSAAEAYATTKAWTVTAGDGPKTVYATFQDAAGNWSAPSTDTIELNAEPPSFTIDEPQPNQIFTAE